MYPELFHLGNFPVPSYGVWLAAGMLLALFVASRLAEKDGLPRERIYDLGLFALLGGLLGAKLLMVLVDPNAVIFSRDFLLSGGVYYGGFIGGLVTVAVLIRWYRLPFWKVADAFAPAVALGQAFGRQGCFAAGCCWGKETHGWWGVHFTDLGHQYTGVPVYGPDGSDLFLYPTQMIESLFMLATFGFLVWLHRHKKFDGQVLIAYGFIYSTFRFFIEFLRDDPQRGDLFGLFANVGLSPSQIISLLVAIVSLVFLIYRMKTVSKAETPPVESVPDV